MRLCASLLVSVTNKSYLKAETESLKRQLLPLLEDYQIKPEVIKALQQKLDTLIKEKEQEIRKDYEGNDEPGQDKKRSEVTSLKDTLVKL